jgi:hypothetical protein
MPAVEGTPLKDASNQLDTFNSHLYTYQFSLVRINDDNSLIDVGIPAPTHTTNILNHLELDPEKV